MVGARVFAGLDDILARAIERSEPAFVLVLDSLEDPQNLGTVLRSAEAAGVHGVVFPTARQAPLSPAAIKASAGATEHLLLCPVDDLAGALTDLHTRGLRIIGTEAEAPMTARQADLRGPIAIVIGSEGHGLAPAIRRRCDLMVRIPMRGAIGSLNAAVAGSVLLFEALGQRDPEARPVVPADGITPPEIGEPRPATPGTVAMPAPGGRRASTRSGGAAASPKGAAAPRRAKATSRSTSATADAATPATADAAPASAVGVPADDPEDVAAAKDRLPSPAESAVAPRPKRARATKAKAAPEGDAGVPIADDASPAADAEPGADDLLPGAPGRSA